MDQRRLIWIVWCAGAIWLAPTQPAEGVDLLWQVGVGARVGAGETLYRDVFCGVTPLAIAVQTALGNVFGHGPDLAIWTMRVLFGISLVVLAAICERIDLSHRAEQIVLGLAFLWATPLTASLYTGWALLFFLAMKWAITSLPNSKRPEQISAVGGMLAGLSFGSKQNIGILACALLMGCIWFLLPERRVRNLTWAMSSFGATVAAILVPVWLAGAWPWFLEQCFTGKSTYMARAGLPYAAFLNWTPFGEIRTSGWATGLAQWAADGVYLAPVAILLLLREGRTGIVLSSFVVTGLAAVYPRPDRIHMAAAAPGLAIATGYVLRRWQKSLAIAALIATLYWCLLPRMAQRPIELAAEAAALRDGVPSGLIFLLHPRAPQYYWAAGIRNPTRYDYPMSTTFGRNGEEEVIRQIRTGQIDRVCVLGESGEWLNMEPRRLMDFVTSSMEPDDVAGPCRIYRRRSIGR